HLDAVAGEGNEDGVLAFLFGQKRLQLAAEVLGRGGVGGLALAARRGEQADAEAALVGEERGEGLDVVFRVVQGRELVGVVPLGAGGKGVLGAGRLPRRQRRPGVWAGGLRGRNAP